MGKILFLILSFLVITAFLTPASALAITCSLRTSPDPIVIPAGMSRLPSDTRVQFNITVDTGGIYDVFLQRGTVGPVADVSFRNLVPSDPALNPGYPANTLLNETNQPPDFVVGDSNLFREGTHSIEIVNNSIRTNNTCRVNYTVTSAIEWQQITCNILGPVRPNTSTEIKYSGTILPAGIYSFLLRTLSTPSQRIESPNFSPNSSGSFPEQNLGRLGPGTYNVVLRKFITSDSTVRDTNCSIAPLTVETTTANPNPNPNNSPIPVASSTPLPAASPGTGPAGSPAVAGGQPCNDARGPGFKTAIGCIHTSPAALVKDVMGFVVGISGGFAFLMMLLGAFQMLTSAGNPETLAAGKDRFTNAIIGLLMVIFAVLLLQIIGFDILRLPGFKR